MEAVGDVRGIITIIHLAIEDVRVAKTICTVPDDLAAALQASAVTVSPLLTVLPCTFNYEYEWINNPHQEASSFLFSLQEYCIYDDDEC